LFKINESNLIMKKICMYDDEEISVTFYMFLEYLSFSRDCQLSENTIRLLNEVLDETTQLLKKQDI
jgi:hypothetical protein